MMVGVVVSVFVIFVAVGHIEVVIEVIVIGLKKYTPIEGDGHRRSHCQMWCYRLGGGGGRTHRIVVTKVYIKRE